MDVSDIVLRAAPSASDPFGGITPAIISAMLASLSLYLTNWGYVDYYGDRVASLWDHDGDQFDFIIVGGGTAGGILAHRLSFDHKVLLLEAGGEINPFQYIPAMSLIMLNYPEIDWKHKTIPQKHACFGLPNNESHWSQGKGLGGTNNLNFLIQSRGNPKDYENWAKILDDWSWSYEGLLPYFKLSEDFEGRWSTTGTHGKGGPMRIAVPEYTGMADLYVTAARELGFKRQDLNGYYTQGFDTIYYPIKNGRRHGVFGAFIEEARYRLSVTIRKYALVRKVLVDKYKRAIGVEYEKNGAIERAYASNEVILSAGSMNSPKILLLSGIGPSSELEYVDVDVVHDLPGVGKNLQDHISTYLGPFFVDEPVTFSIDRDINPITIAQFMAQGTGILTTSGTQAMGFFTSTEAKEAGQEDWPDIQVILAGVSIGEKFAENFARGFGPKREVLEKYYKHAVGKDSFLQIVSLGRPKARGYVALQSRDPNVPAIIDPQYLNNKHDIDVLIEAVKTAVNIVEKTRTFRRINGRFTNVPFPGCEHVPFRSDKYWECYIRNFAITLHHIVGSCSMGKRTDPYAVVDKELKVIGIEGLRVVDASVMPVVVVGNTNAPTVAIAEKAADLIIKEWSSSKAEEKRKTFEPDYDDYLEDSERTNNSKVSSDQGSQDSGKGASSFNLLDWFTGATSLFTPLNNGKKFNNASNHRNFRQPLQQYPPYFNISTIWKTSPTKPL